jgi:galactose-1-phosphate uridylyltransferase
MKDQNFKEYEILESHSDIDIASIRERELQKQYGYKIDNNSYKHITSFAKINGIKNKHSGHMHRITKLGSTAVKNKYSKPILCYDKFTNTFLNEYTSQKEASRLLNIDEASIRKILKGKRKNVSNYTFTYK